MGMGGREVCCGVWEGVLDDMHGLDFVLLGDVKAGDIVYKF